VEVGTICFYSDLICLLYVRIARCEWHDMRMELMDVCAGRTFRKELLDMGIFCMICTPYRR
jgi:hypothetical protein